MSSGAETAFGGLRGRHGDPGRDARVSLVVRGVGNDALSIRYMLSYSVDAETHLPGV